MLSARIVDRYLLTECVRTWLAVVVVLAVLTLSIGFARFIGQAAAGELSATTVLAVAAYSAVEKMEIVLPVSLLLAVLLTVGRLCRDNEMAALSAGGVGLAAFYRPFAWFTLLLGASAAWLSFSLAPQANTALAKMRQQVNVSAQLQSFAAQRFHTLMGGRAAFYAASKQPQTGEFHNIFIRVRDKDNKETVVLANTAIQQSNADTGQQTLVLRDGWRYEGIPGQAGYRIIRFAEHGVHVHPPDGEAGYGLDQMDNAALMRQDNRAAQAELQRRLGVPILVVLLGLLALPLGYLPPRAGRYGRLVAGVMVYLAYANGLRLAQLWFVQGRTPAVLGLWWVHILILAIALGLIARRQGWFALLYAQRTA